MDSKTKESHIKRVCGFITDVQKNILLEAKRVRKLVDTKVGSAKVEDSWTNAEVKAINQTRLNQLDILHGSPFFNKCEATFNGIEKDYYFAKFPFTEDSIYSWVSPIASIRFDNPGEASYTLPTGEKRIGKIKTKENYQIIDGKLLFYSRETIDNPPELIYQENFTQKRGFILPEIVSQMEKVQDTIIRADYRGPFQISGPAGSGKTTLALHRIAYLLQAPHTSEIYANQSIIVFVQDQKSKNYFSQLLPELGIKSVIIETFPEWALEIMNLKNVSAVSSYSHNLYYEFQKIEALRYIVANNQLPKFSENAFSILNKIYSNKLSAENLSIFKEQNKNMVLDRIDLTAILTIYRNHYKKISISREMHDFDANGKYITKKKKVLLDYAIIMVDEFQNYIPEQIDLLKSCLNKENESIIYVGDATQQINPGTKEESSGHNAPLNQDRYVKLQKVYRNTKKIIQYIADLGYDIKTPTVLKDGSDVIEKTFQSRDEHVSYVKNIVKNLPDKKSIGILALENKNLEIFRESIETNEYVHLLTIRESQGLEFDIVILIDFEKETYFEEYKKSPQDFQAEKQKIDKDLLYIGLTRAISDLHIISSLQ